MLMSLYSLQCESSDLSFFYEALKLGDWESRVRWQFHKVSECENPDKKKKYVYKISQQHQQSTGESVIMFGNFLLQVAP